MWANSLVKSLKKGHLHILHSTYDGSEQYMPAGQSEHSVCPIDPLVDWPNAQATGGWSVKGQAYPEGQAVQVASLARLYSPSVQLAVEPREQLKPAGHRRHMGTIL